MKKEKKKSWVQYDSEPKPIKPSLDMAGDDWTLMHGA